MFELDDETRWILGRPNFACAGIAACLRKLGHEIAQKAEAEQAATLHWMLCLYETHGADWRDQAEAIIKSTRPRPVPASDLVPPEG